MIVFCLFLGACYWGWTEITGKNLGDLIHLKKVEVNHIESLAVVDKNAAHPAVLDQSGTRVDYNAREKAVASVSPTPDKTQQPEAVDIAPIILVDNEATPTPAPTPEKAVPAPTTIWLPESSLIPCLLQNELDSGHMAVPIILVVAKDIYQQNYGRSHLVIRAGSKLMSFASAGRHNDHITAEGEWHCILVHEATSVSFTGILLDMEWDPESNEFGVGDKSPGIKGTIIKDQYEWLRGLLGTLVMTVANAAGQVSSSALQRGTESTNVNVDTSSVPTSIGKYVDMLIGDHPGDVNDTIRVQVPPWKQCYVVLTGPLEPGKASIGARVQAQIKKEQERLDREQEPRIQVPTEGKHEESGAHFSE